MSVILPLVASGLATALSIDPTRVIITALDFDDAPHLGAEHDVLIGFGNEYPDVPRDGGGRAVNERTRILQFALRTRFLADMPDRDVLKLLRASVGHIALEDAIVDALESLVVVDSDSNVLALPLLVGEWSKPRRSGRGDVKDRAGYLMSWMNVKVRYLRNVSQP